MAFIRKAKLMRDLLDGHLVMGDAFFDQFGSKIMNVVPIADGKNLLKIGTEIRFCNIKVCSNSLHLYLLRIVNILMDKTHNIFSIQSSTGERMVDAFHGFFDESENG